MGQRVVWKCRSGQQQQRRPPAWRQQQQRQQQRQRQRQQQQQHRFSTPAGVACIEDPFAKIIASIVGQQLSSRLDRGSLGPHPERRGPEAGIVFLQALEHEEQNLESG